MSDNQSNDSHWDDPRVTAYVLDAIEPTERAEFERELRENESLARAVDEAREVTGQLELMFASESKPTLDDYRRCAIINEPVIVRESDEVAGRRVVWTLVAIAAALLLMFGVAPMLVGDRQTKVSQVRSVAPESPEPEVESRGPAVAMSVVAEKETAASEVQPSKPVEVMFQAEQGKKVASAESEGLARTRIGAQPRIQNFSAPARQQAQSAESLDMAGSLGNNFDFADQRMMMDEASQRSRSIRMATGGVAELRGRYGNPSMEAMMGGGGMAGGDSERLFEDRFSSFVPEPARLGRGSGDRFDTITDNAFKRVSDEPLSTFSVDVDTASYSKIRDYVLRSKSLPPRDAVRIEEMINYFGYADAPPADDEVHPFAARVNITSCPWNTKHRLARIAIKGKTMQPKQRPACNLVFLIDTSGSMQDANKLPLVINGLKMLTRQLGENDRVAIVVYASSTGLVLESTPATKQKKIRKALKQLTAGGSTNGGAGISLAYQTARDNFIDGGVNRVILCTDGDFNVGTTNTDQLVAMVENEAKGNVFLSVLGFGMGNHNDAMLEQISGKGNGNYAFVDSKQEAKKVLVQQLSGTLVTIAKDVKLQIEFNPGKVSAYRLIGYENRVLAKEDFNDDKKDAGEIGAGHSVTALYELVPAGVESSAITPAVDDLKYQKSDPVKAVFDVDNNETMTVKVRYKQPEGDVSTKVEFPVVDDGAKFTDASIDHQFTAAVAGFGMQLRHSEHSGSWKLKDVLQVARSSKGDDVDGLRGEFIEIVGQAIRLNP